MNKLKLPIALFGLIGLFVFSSGAYAQAGIFNGVCDDTTTDATVCREARDSTTDTAQDNSVLGPDGVLMKVVNLVSIAVGVAAVIMIIIGGLQYILSAGDSAKAINARNTILYAIVGIMVVVSAQALIIFVINKV